MAPAATHPAPVNQLQAREDQDLRWLGALLVLFSSALSCAASVWMILHL